MPGRRGHHRRLGRSSSTQRGSWCGSARYQAYDTANPNARQTMPPTASSQKWFAVATITTSVTTGYSSPRILAHGALASAKMVSPHQSDQPMCMEGIAANWFDTALKLPEAIEPQVSWAFTVSMKFCPFISRGGASGYR